MSDFSSIGSVVFVSLSISFSREGLAFRGNTKNILNLAIKNEENSDRGNNA